jgi:PAS domain S-box-containing protein
VAWSPGLEEIHGLPAGGFGGTFEHFIRDVHPEDRQRVSAQIEQTVANRADHLIEYRLLLGDGSVKWVEGRGSLVCAEDGAPLRMIGVCADITRRKQAEQERADLLARERQARADAERASKAKDEFLAVLSHELRTPLTPVLLTVTLMENSPDLSEEQRRDLQTIRRNIELEAHLIDDLLDLTRIARGKLQLDMEPIDMHVLVRSAADIAHRADEVDLVQELHAEAHSVRADPARLQQVLWNLLNNAHKFTPSGGTIKVRTSNTAAGWIRVEVIDSGVGIDQQMLPTIFTAFTQGHAESRRFGGLGLGLAISRALVEAQGGRLYAQSDGRGRGATFTLEMPTIPVPAPAHEPPGRGAGDPVSTRRPLRILIVEDHDATRLVMTKLLAKLGHAPVPAVGVESAIRAMRDHPVDLVISDIGLPDGTGHELMRRIRTSSEVPGIALSGYGMDEDLRRSEEAGFAEHLIKPVDVHRLQAAIHRVADHALSL